MGDGCAGERGGGAREGKWGIEREREGKGDQGVKLGLGGACVMWFVGSSRWGFGRLRSDNA